MSESGIYLAVFLGNESSPRMRVLNALPEEERHATMQKGIAAWKTWADVNQGAIVGIGGPPGKTKRVTSRGIEDLNDHLTA